MKLCIVERELPKVIFPKLPRLRLFDVLVMFDHLLDEDVWRLDLKMLGIDITIHSPPATELASSFPVSHAIHFQDFLSERRREKDVLLQ